MDEQTNMPKFTDEDKRETSFHNFDAVAEVVGKLKGIPQGAYGDQYLIETEKGEITVGSYDVLKSKILTDDIGKDIKIVFNGNKVSPKTSRSYKDFTVFIK